MNFQRRMRRNSGTRAKFKPTNLNSTLARRES